MSNGGCVSTSSATTRLHVLSEQALLPIIVVVAIARSGVNSFGALDSHLEVGQAFPDVSGYFQSSWLHFAIWRVTGISTAWQAVIYGVVLATVLLVLIQRFSRLSRVDDEQTLAFAILVLSPVLTVLVVHLGIYDSLMMVGAVLLAGTSSKWWMMIGAILLLGANFELGMVALSSLAVLSYSPEIQIDRRNFVLASAVGVMVSLVALVGWFGNFLGGDSRSSWLQEHLRGSIVNFVVSLPLIVLSFYGVAWLLVGGFLLSSRSYKSIVIHLTALLLLPGIATAATLDGTRVFVCASAPALFALVLRGKRPIRDFLPTWVGTRSLLVLSLLVPAVVVHFGSVKLPFQILYGRL